MKVIFDYALFKKQVAQLEDHNEVMKTLDTKLENLLNMSDKFENVKILGINNNRYELEYTGTWRHFNFLTFIGLNPCQKSLHFTNDMWDCLFLDTKEYFYGGELGSPYYDDQEKELKRLGYTDYDNLSDKYLRIVACPAVQIYTAILNKCVYVNHPVCY